MRMQNLLQAARDRTGRMMSLLGHDPEELRMRAIITERERQAIAERCLGCACTDECEAWMADSHADHAAAPEYCRNKFLFDVLTG